MWIVALLPVFSIVALLLGLIGLIVAIVVVAVVVVSHVALTRRGLDGETIIGGIIGTALHYLRYGPKQLDEAD